MSAVREVARRPAAYARATLTALAAAQRLARWQRQLAFDDLVIGLREGPLFPASLADPLVHARVVGRLARLLPPRGMGLCLKRSLLLLGLWSRCGLTPALHVAVSTPGERPWRGHAWLTAEAPQGPLAAGDSGGLVEAFVF
jgi:hypothetical protein